MIQTVHHEFHSLLLDNLKFYTVISLSHRKIEPQKYYYYNKIILIDLTLTRKIYRKIGCGPEDRIL